MDATIEEFLACDNSALMICEVYKFDKVKVVETDERNIFSTGGKTAPVFCQRQRACLRAGDIISTVSPSAKRRTGKFQI